MARPIQNVYCRGVKTVKAAYASADGKKRPDVPPGRCWHTLGFSSQERFNFGGWELVLGRFGVPFRLQTGESGVGFLDLEHGNEHFLVHFGQGMHLLFPLFPFEANFELLLFFSEL